MRNVFASELSNLALKKDGDKVVEYVASYQKLKAYVIPMKLRKEVERIVANIGSERLSYIEETMENYDRKIQKISNELRRLMFKVDHGEPLLGTCDLCPKSTVSSKC
jgi:predicted transcriptional regulator